jgi:hypothetical protein
MARQRRALPLAPLLAALVTAGLPAAAGAASCPNEPLRTGRSAALPDCRAYELVTPENVDSAGGDMLFEEGLDTARVSGDGEHLALEARAVFFQPAELAGTVAVFSRGAGGWGMRSLVAPGLQGEKFQPEVLSPDFSQVGFLPTSGLTPEAPLTFDVGPVGGPYTPAASRIVNPEGRGEGAAVDGANAGVPGGVPPFSDLVLETQDRELLPPGPERTAAEETAAGKLVLYDWSDGQLHLVNVYNNGKLVSPCGAKLGFGEDSGNNLGAVSADGSRIFFTSPEKPRQTGCGEPALYMRSGGETVDVSEPEGVSLAPSERGAVVFDGASPDGTKVFFNSESALTPGAGAGPYLYEYDVQAPAEHRLTLIAGTAEPIEKQFANPEVTVSADGTAVYYQGTEPLEVRKGVVAPVTGIWHYDVATRASGFVAVPTPTKVAAGEQWYATPDGRFLMFMSGSEGAQVVGPGGLAVEPRGLGNQQLYRYDALNGSVSCVSCGDGARAPSQGKAETPTSVSGGSSLMKLGGAPGAPVDVSNDGSRVFFQTSARLVPQDTNEDTLEEESGGNEALGRASDVYEWVADGAEDGPGTSCRLAVGCTFLISAGEPVGPSRFLGASQDGRDVFFSSAASLVPGAPAGFSSVYDARIGGGFPQKAGPVQCTACQGVGAPPPQFGASASETFAGTGNPPVPAAPAPATSKAKSKPKPHCRRGYKRNRRGRCVKARRSSARRKP